MQKLLRGGGFNAFGEPEDVEPEAEGELSYHSRHCEGGPSLFLVP